MRDIYIYISLLVGEIILAYFLPISSWIDLGRNLIIMCIITIAAYYILPKLSYIFFKDKK